MHKNCDCYVNDTNQVGSYYRYTHHAHEFWGICKLCFLIDSIEDIVKTIF